MIPIIAGVLGIVTKGSEKILSELEIRGRIETAVLRSARILN